MKLRKMLVKVLAYTVSAGMTVSTLSGFALGTAYGIRTEKDAFALENADTDITKNWTDEGNYDISWYDEAKDKFYISTPQQLAGVAVLVNGDNEISFQDKTIYLNADIDLSGALWEPIGQEFHEFCGSFNGLGHSVRNMKINKRTYINEDGAEVTNNLSGFFGKVYGYETQSKNLEYHHDGDVFCGTTIANLFIENCDVYGGDNTAAMVGEAWWCTIYNCGVTGKVSGKSGSGSFVGKLNNVLVVNSYSTADYVSGSDGDEYCYDGGFAGDIRFSAICNSYYSGKVSGLVKGAALGYLDHSNAYNVYVNDIDNDINSERAESGLNYYGITSGYESDDFKGMSAIMDEKDNYAENLAKKLNDNRESSLQNVSLRYIVKLQFEDFEVKDEVNNGMPTFTAIKSGNLVAAAEISSDYVMVGDEVSICVDAEGGQGDYTYSFYVHNTDTDTVFKLTDNVSNNVYTWIPESEGNREFYADVKDSEGNIIRTNAVSVFAEQGLGVKASVNKAFINVGDSVKISANAYKGYGTYKYSYLVHNLDNETWFRLTDFVEEDSYTWTAGSAGNREFFVEVMDNDEWAVRSNPVKVEVEEPDSMEVFASTSANIIKVGDKITIDANAAGGEGEYTYSFLVHNLDNGSWYRMSGFTGNRSIEWTAGSAGNREFFVEAKDAGGQVVRSSAINVKTAADGELCVAGEASADRIKVGDEITIKANAYGGDEAYTYSYLVHNTENNTWYRMSGFTANDSITWRAGSTGNREFFVEVKDGNEDVVRSAAVNVAVK